MICKLCNKPINPKKDKYNHVEDFDGEEKVDEMWCHRKCFNKAMNKELTDLHKMAKGMLMQAGGIMENLPDELKPKQEFVIN